MPRIVRGKLRLRVVVHADQIANGVPVLHAVQTADGDAPRIRIGGINAKDMGFDPLFDLLFFGGRGPGHVGRGHGSTAQVFQRLPKQFAILRQRRVGSKFIESHIAGLHCASVTGIAIGFEKRLNALWKFCRADVYGSNRANG